MNEISELALLRIMQLLARWADVGPLIQCCQRFVVVAKKYRLYGYSIRSNIAAIKIARAYHTYCKFGGKTFASWSEICHQSFRDGVLLYPPRLHESGIVTQESTLDWSQLSRQWLNQQNYVNSSVFVDKDCKGAVLPRNSDILRTITIIAGNSKIALARLYVTQNGTQTTVECTQRHKRRIEWEVNLPLTHCLAYLKFEFSGSTPDRVVLSMRGCYLFNDSRTLLIQSAISPHLLAAARDVENFDNQLKLRYV
jgi:hypothetical protein